MTKSKTLFESLKKLVPGGIDGNAKVFPGLMPVIVKSDGCRLFDADGNSYIDYCSGYGPLIFGHGDRELVEAIKKQLDIGMLYGLPHELMYEAASMVSEFVPCVEMIRFTNSGTEATLNAIRLARGVTKRDKILKFYGAYHGTHESVLISTKIVSPKPEFPKGEPNSAGLPQSIINDTYVLPFNDKESARELIEKRAEEIAAVIVEPVLGSYGIVVEKPFLEELRRVTAQNGILLIFDEVITGFRLAKGGAQEIFGVIPDLVTLGKTMGGGFPIAAFAGAAKYMEHVVPSGNSARDSKEIVYHSGTYNSNPLGLTAVVTSLAKLRDGRIHRKINANGEKLRTGIKKLMETYGLMGTTAGFGSIVQWYFGIEGQVRSLSDTLGSDKNRAQECHARMIEHGVFFIGAPRGFVSSAHEDQDINLTLETMERVFREMTDKR